MSARFLLPLLAGCVLLFGGCKDRSKPAAGSPVPVTYEGRGVLQEVKGEGRKAVIAHETIPGYMEAMTMEFTVEDGSLLKGLVRGDELTFRLLIDETHGWIDQVRKTGHRELPALAEKPVKEGEVGASLPDCELVDQRGQSFHLSGFKGRALAITFIYTSCPFPDFCPRISNQFGETQRALVAAGAGDRWHLLSISIDPQRDTPERLAEYAQRYAADPAHWTFATGDSAEIEKVAGTFGVVVTKEGVQWDHNLRTVVIDPAGKVQKIFAGNGWKPEELAAELKRALPAAN